MPERKKLELELNKTVSLELLFDEPVIGQSQFGEYYLYAVRNGSNTEYSFFAPDDVHKELIKLSKGDRVLITKLAEQVGKKIITKHVVKVLSEQKQAPPQNNSPVNGKGSNPINNGNGAKDSYYEVMLQSYQDSLKIQEQLNGMVDVNRIAITLFIARSKINGNGYS